MTNPRKHAHRFWLARVRGIGVCRVAYVGGNLYINDTPVLFVRQAGDAALVRFAVEAYYGRDARVLAFRPISRERYFRK